MIKEGTAEIAVPFIMRRWAIMVSESCPRREAAPLVHAYPIFSYFVMWCESIASEEARFSF